MLTVAAHAKVNLALVVGGRRDDGKHEVVTVVEKLGLADTVTVAPADALAVEGFAEDTIVRGALAALAERAGVEPRFAATIDKRIPVAAGLGGGSSDAAAALRLANQLLPLSLARDVLEEVGATLGADVPLFLRQGAVLAIGDGSTVEPLSLPRDYHVVLWLPAAGEKKQSTGAVYRDFDRRDGAAGYDARRAALIEALAAVTAPADLARLPLNDLASSPRAAKLLALGAFRADVTGAGPVLYGLFHDPQAAGAAAATLSSRGRTWLTAPAPDR